MTAKQNDFESDLLELLFTNSAAGSHIVAWGSGLLAATTAGNVRLSLHTASPGEAGAQNTTEISYTGYARPQVARSTAGWTVTANQVANDAIITFGEKTNTGSSTAGDVGIGGDNATGAGELFYYGALTSDLAVGQNVEPQFAISALTVDED